MKTDVEKYVQGWDICMSSKVQRYKLYGSIQASPVSSQKWKDIRIYFVTGIPKSKDWRVVEYDSIFFIIDWLTKMIYYEPLLITLTIEQLAKALIEEVIKYHCLPDFIVIDQRSLFTSKFCSSFCYYLNV